MFLIVNSIIIIFTDIHYAFIVSVNPNGGL